jgi:hypothetical protein
LGEHAETFKKIMEFAAKVGSIILKLDNVAEI